MDVQKYATNDQLRLFETILDNIENSDWRNSYSQAKAETLSANVLATEIIEKEIKVTPQLLHLLIRKVTDTAVLHLLFDKSPLSFCNSYFYSSFISSKSDFARRAYQEALEMGNANAVVRNKYMFAAAKEEGYPKAKAIYMRAVESQECDPCTFADFIRLAGENNDFEAGCHTYRLANEKQLVNAYTVTNFMVAAGNVHRFDLVNMALQQAQRLNLHQPEIYTVFIKQADRANRFEDALKAFKTTQDKKPFVYTAFIKAAGNAKNYLEVKNALYEAKRNNCADRYLYVAFFKAATKCGKLLDAKKEFKQLDLNGKIDSFICAVYISAAVAARNLAEVKHGMQIAQECSLDDFVVHLIYSKGLNNWDRRV